MAAEPTIQILAEKLIGASGVEWRLTHAALSDVVHNLSIEEFLGEVVRITNPKVFNVLWSVGLSRAKQDICLAREAELR